jgi:cyclophilin family peptidyl-prolyl cis-trans isomerase
MWRGPPGGHDTFIAGGSPRRGRLILILAALAIVGVGAVVAFLIVRGSMRSDPGSSALTSAKAFFTAWNLGDCNAVYDDLASSTRDEINQVAKDNGVNPEAVRQAICAAEGTQGGDRWNVEGVRLVTVSSERVTISVPGTGPDVQDALSATLIKEAGGWKVDLHELITSGRNRAADRATQSKLRNSLTAEKVYFIDHQAYTDDPDELKKIEDSLTYARGVASASSPSGTVYAALSGARHDILCLSSRSDAGELFMIKDMPEGPHAGTTYGQGATLGMCDSSPLATSWAGAARPSSPPTPRVTSCDDARGSVAGKPQFPAAPAQMLDPAKSYIVTLETSKGRIVARLSPEIAPIAVNSFVFLVRCGFYDGTLIHRVVKDFVIQGGDPTGTGKGGPGYRLPDELPPQPGYAIGALAMANAGPNTAGSQFFIVTGDKASSLPNKYSLLGEVTQGQDVAKAIEQVPSTPAQDGRPNDTVMITKVTITEG